MVDAARWLLIWVPSAEAMPRWAKGDGRGAVAGVTGWATGEPTDNFLETKPQPPKSLTRASRPGRDNCA